MPLPLWVEPGAAGRAAWPLAHVRRADRWFTRLRGLIGHPPLRAGEGLWIVPCRQVHTHFMRAPIDVVFLDRSLTVLHVLPALAPWRVSPWVRGAHSVVELAAGQAARLQCGDVLTAGSPGRSA